MYQYLSCPPCDILRHINNSVREVYGGERKHAFFARSKISSEVRRQWSISLFLSCLLNISGNLCSIWLEGICYNPFGWKSRENPCVLQVFINAAYIHVSCRLAFGPDSTKSFKILIIYVDSVLNKLSNVHLWTTISNCGLDWSICSLVAFSIQIN